MFVRIRVSFWCGRREGLEMMEIYVLMFSLYCISYYVIYVMLLFGPWLPAGVGATAT